ncbi:MAG: efflux RND transporter permease subunit, partial [Campylobacterales bacterium]|nr:efflux RND transporter permease subunit [Campylobacterales bacterium]
MFSKFFIERPALSIVMSIVIVLAGAVALFNLPIQQYPQIMPPQVVVSTAYPGANAQTIAKTVASPIEEQINGVEDMLYVNSASSASGTLAINVYFKTGTDPDMATINVNNRVQAVLSRLPIEVQRNGVTVMKRDSNFLEVVNLYSPDDSRKPLFLANYALINMIDDFKRIPGVGDARLFGTQDYAIRVWIDPLKLSKYNLTPTDVITRIQEQNAQFAAGKLGQEPISSKQMFTYTITSEGRLTKPEEFSEIIIRSNPDGSALRLKNVATVELGAQAYDIHMMESGKETVAMGIFLQTGANALEVANAVQKTLDKLEKKFPSGVAYGIPYDSTKFVKISIEEVQKTLLEAMLLVVLVVFVFLQKWRATLIPLLAIPVSIIGTFAGMYAFGFSI